jgi:hypothetical protein
LSQILNKPTLFSGAYNDLTGKPTLGTAAATNSTAYATAAQGATADAALPKAGGTMTGAISFAAGQTFPGAGEVTLAGTETLTNKTLTSPVITQNIQLISTNTTAIKSRTYVMTASLTLTLPATPTAGDTVMFANRSTTATPIIARNGSNIMGLAEDMTVDNVNYFATLVFADATRGWIFQ